MVKKEVKGGKRQYSDADKATALAALDANGGNVSLTAKQTGVPRKTLEDWSKGRKVVDDVAEMRHLKKGELADRLEEVAHALIENIHIRATNEFSPLVPLKDYATAFGIIIDKRQLLKGKPTSIYENLTDVEKAQKAAELLERGRLRLVKQ